MAYTGVIETNYISVTFIYIENTCVGLTACTTK